jgi:hypothetical protein
MDGIVIIYANGLCYCSVCTSLTDVAELTRRVNKMNPTGVSPWRVHDSPFRDGQANPHPCETRPGRMHYLFSC